MSGGVDSSTAAGLLLEQGHEVVGATLKLWGGVSDSGCCSVADVEDARRVAQTLGSTTTSLTTPKSSNATSSGPSSRVTSRASRQIPASSAIATSSSTCCSSVRRRLGFDAVATGHHAQVVERAASTFGAWGGRSEGPELRAWLSPRRPARDAALAHRTPRQKRRCARTPNDSAFAPGISPTARTSASSKPPRAERSSCASARH